MRWAPFALWAATRPIEDGPMMDMSIYTTIFADKVAAMVFFGAPADVQAQEELILQMLGSTQME